MDDNIYVHANGNNYGPLTAAELTRWAREGRLSGDHYVWAAEQGRWVRAADINFLAPVLAGGGDANYHVRIGDDTIGPMDLQEVVGLIAARRFNAMDFIWLEEEKRWARAGDVPFLSPHFLKQIREEVEEARLEKELEALDDERPVDGGETYVMPAWRKEARRDLARDDDRNFLKTLAAMFLIQILVITTINFVEVPKPEEVKPAEVVSRVAKLVVDKPIDIPLEPVVAPEDIISTTGETPGGEASGGGGGQGGEDYASTGVVGLITTMGPGGSVADLMAAGGDLDIIASNVGGLKTGGSGTVGRGTGGGFGPGGPGFGLGGGIGSGLGALLGTKRAGMTKLKAGRVRVSPPGITGAAATNSLRSSAVIARIVNQRKQGIEYIYKKYLKTNPTLEGKIVVRFTIAASGSVAAASVVSSSIGNPALESEVCARIMTWRFPPIDAGDVTVVYPFVFFSAGA